jgi:hypothetical protein
MSTGKWTSGGGSVGSGGRNGTNRLFGGNNTGVLASRVFSSTYSTLIEGCGCRFDSNAGGQLRYFLAFLDAGSLQMGVRVNPTSHLLEIVRGATLLATGTTPIVTGVYNYIELKVVFATGATGSYTVKLNGVTELTASTVQTAATAHAYADTVTLGWTTNNGASDVQESFDDFYCNDSSGAQCNDFDGDQRIEAIFPSADGAHSAWIPSTGVAHAALVDETTPNDDTDYVGSSVLNDIDTWAMGNVTPTSGAVKAIQIMSWVRKDDAGVRTVAPVLRMGSTDHVLADLPSLGTTYQYQPRIVEVSPDTGGSTPFTITEINAMEAGIKLTA